MTEFCDEVIDSQIIAEQVGFLDNCFDNSFSLQSSLAAVKEYVAEESKISSNLKTNQEQLCKKINASILNKTSTLGSNTDDLIKSTALLLPQQQNVMNRNLQAWGLPEEIAMKYKQRGITEMFEWQVTCLANSKVLLDCSNLVYSAPTSAGKTLVAEILTIKTILERQKKVIIILPFVSIVREKMFYLQDILSSSGIRVEGFMGSQTPPGGLQSVHVGVCTIEKANSLLNRLLNDGNISDLGAVIVDELHLLGDPHRGYILELLLTKIKYVSSKCEDVQIQIIGMSATLPNLEVLANWLTAELFITQFRPIPLDEFCLVGKQFYDKTGTCVNTLNVPNLSNHESDNVLNICLDTIKDGCSILIFCMTKSRCENLAQSLASSFYSLGCQQCESGSILRNQLKTDSISEVLEQLKGCPVGLDQVLLRTISFGVAYHHAGLTFDERDIIEGAFKSGAIRVLVATSTLSSGVNLPARKVIIRSPVFLRQPINIMTYKQMIGRAGRMGKDTKGESILICTENEKKIGFDLMMGALDPVKSCIESEDKYMRAILEMIASQVLCTKAELDLYSKCTLLSTQQDFSKSHKLMDNTLSELQNYELIRVQNDEEEHHYVATPLGKACLSASMAPNDGLSLFVELQKARQCLVLETDLHLIYLVTPYSVSSQWGDIDWLHLLTLWEALTKAMKRVGELIGIQESFIIRCLRGTNKMNNAQSKLNVHKRFYTALALQDLVNEVPLSEVAMKFQCARGFLQSLQQSAATFAGMVTAFCHQLGWKNMEILVSQFQDRLHFGIHSELLELMKLPSLNGIRARALFDAGFETVSSIASADRNIIENILHKAVPFQSEKVREGDDGDDLKKRNKIKSIWITGCCGMTAKEAALNLINEARKYIENEIGVTDIKWSTRIASTVSKESHSFENPERNTSQLVQKFKQETHDEFHTENSNLGPEPNRTTVQLEENKSRKVSINLLENSSEDIYFSANVCKAEHETKPAKLEENTDDKKEKKALELSQIYTTKGEVLSQMRSTAISESIHCTAQNDIEWDSLNFTEAGIQNITKLRTSDKMFSPNLSFGDTDKSSASMNALDENVSAKCTSAKDESLFSTDGQNSSFFEESLPLDLIPSKLFDNKNSPVTISKRETTAEFAYTVSNSILNGFKSPIIKTDDEEDIKLVYDEDNKSDCQTDDINLSKENEVVCSQETIPTIKDFKSPYKRRMDDREIEEHRAKKNKLNVSVAIKRNNTYVTQLDFIDSAKVTIQINDYCIKCIQLIGNDIHKNMPNIENMQAASVYLNVSNRSFTMNEIIGQNILNIPRSETLVQIIPGGMAIYLGHDTCLYIDLVSLEKQVILEKKRLKCWIENDSILLKMFSLKQCYFYMKKWLDISLPYSCADVSLAEWLINSDERIPNIEFLMKRYCGVDLSTASIKIENKRKAFKSLDSNIVACIRAWCVWKIAEKQEACLHREYHVSQNVIDIEKQVATILGNCEFHGITIDRQLASQMLLDVKRSQDILQKKANKIAGCNVNMNSSKAVAKVLGIYRSGKVSTKKSVLTCHNSVVSSLIIYWRKLNCILTKTLYPLTEKAHVFSEGNRINPTYTMHTCTGRISMHEPNLQNVPRTFSIPCTHLEDTEQAPSTDVIEFNCRNIFKATPGYVMVSADYCQLEMRILTHFSEDSVLVNIMRSGVDVFKSIAASWSNLPEQEVDDDLRHKAKQLCYGILYGMGNKTLAQHLEVTEMEAAFFMDSFYKTFPDVRKYTQVVIDECRRKGYVETLMERRRYLPGIKSNIVGTRSAAERQAVNTTIQGTAADIAKAAMCAIDNYTSNSNPRLLLQMHDELIYEVPENSQQNFIRIMKKAMEGTIQLKVPLPVKIKCGHTWGALKEVTL